MLELADDRLPGRVVAGSADTLPIRSGSVDLVTTIWLLHLLPIEIADRVVSEAARVIRPGGHFVTTVDKDLADGRDRRTNADHAERISGVAGRHGLGFLGATSFAASTRWGPADGGKQVFPMAAYRKTGDRRPATGDRPTADGDTISAGSRACQELIHQTWPGRRSTVATGPSPTQCRRRDCRRRLQHSRRERSLMLTRTATEVPRTRDNVGG